MHNLYYYTKFKSKWEEKLVNVGEIYCYIKIRLWGRQSANKEDMNILSPYLHFQSQKNNQTYKTKCSCYRTSRF